MDLSKGKLKICNKAEDPNTDKAKLYLLRPRDAYIGNCYTGLNVSK